MCHDFGTPASVSEQRARPVMGYALARRLSRPVLVEDLGRVRISRGSTRRRDARSRRKVLALLCLLLTRPRMALTRDEVVDSLWPENDPTSALNSLNQTVYFLRRVLEPEYAEDLSPGYVGQDGETIWLDPELVDSSSRRCLEIIRAMPGEPTPEGALRLAAEYTGRFALDFAYEEWARLFPRQPHAAYLRVMEHSLRLDMNAATSPERRSSPKEPLRQIPSPKRCSFRLLGSTASPVPTPLRRSNTAITRR